MPPDVRDWLPEGHLAWFVLDAVSGMDLREFYAVYRRDGVGRRAYDPAMVVALLLYSYARGVSLPGFDGDRSARIPTSGKEVRSYGKTIEVSAGVDGPRCAAGAGVGPAGGAGRARYRASRPEALRKRVRQG